MPNPPPHLALPDELLQSILSPHLEVPDHLFADTEETSPFATPTESSSSVLLVCKVWMRAATPLLYEVVILRSKAQALALERTLKKSKELGRCIKKLRLEGGFGAPMAKIITEAPNIKELCMTMQVWPTDTVSGLTKALHLIQPERVILGRGLDPDDNFASMDNRSTRAIMNKLCSCIEKEWHTLKTFDYPYSFEHDHKFGKPLALSLAKSKSIETILVPFIFKPDLLKFMTKSQCLQRILVKYPSKGLLDLHKSYRRRHEDQEREVTVDELLDERDMKHVRAARAAVGKDKRLRSIVAYEETLLPSLSSSVPDVVVVPLNPSYVPMLDAPSAVREGIWARILSYALQGGTRRGYELPDDDERESRWKRQFIRSADLRPIALSTNRLWIASVSKQFWRYAEPYLYRDIELEDIDAINAFGSLLRNKPYLISHTHTLTFRRGHKNTYDSEEVVDDAYFKRTKLKQESANEVLKLIFSSATNLVTVKQVTGSGACSSFIHHNMIPWDFIDSFPLQNNIKKIDGLCFSTPSSDARYTSLHRFSQVVYLSLEMKFDKELIDKIRSALEALPQDSFPVLETLSYAEGTCFMRGEWPVLSLLGALAHFESVQPC